MSKTPQATISVGDAKIQRDVCSLQLRTRGEDGNTLRLTGGVDICVSDEFAEEVASQYFDAAESDTATEE
jgi:hypothetical protein